MIIGISGKISLGKDTVGKIIQYIIDESQVTNAKDYPLSFEDYCKDEALHNSQTWIIKRFAGKVKEICSILTGIPVADFEKQEVKDRVLGEEWNKPKYRCLEDKCTIDGAFNGYGCTADFSVDCPKEARPLESMTVRQLLQQVGTDAMRNIIHPNVWVNALFADYKCISTGTFGNRQPDDLDDMPYNYPNWIITDTRFPNEAEAIKSRGGLLIRVNRESQADRFAKQDEDKAKYHHPSETALDSYTGFDEVIDNNGSIEELIEKVKVILIKHKIL